MVENSGNSFVGCRRDFPGAPNFERSGIPALVKFTVLSHVRLVDNHQLRTLPDSFGQLGRLQKFVIEKSPLNKLPESFENLDMLQTVIVRDSGLMFFPETAGLRNLCVNGRYYRVYSGMPEE